MTPNELEKMTIAMRTGEIKMEREGNYWTDDERAYAKRRFYEGAPINEIAIELKRSETAVQQQVLQLYVRPPENIRKRQNAPRDAVCLCATCTCERSLCPLCQVYQQMQEVQQSV